MSAEWLFVGACYGLTWLVVGGYALRLRRGLKRAEARLRRADGRDGNLEEGSV